MRHLRESSFAILNGRCQITAEALEFTYDPPWDTVLKIFGQPTQKKGILLGLAVSAPLLSLAAICFAGGRADLAAYLLPVGMPFLTGAISMLFRKEYLYPASVPRIAIHSITSRPPGTLRLGLFTILYQHEGHILRTAFNLPNGTAHEQSEAYQAILENFRETGLMAYYLGSAS